MVKKRPKHTTNSPEAVKNWMCTAHAEQQWEREGDTGDLMAWAKREWAREMEIFEKKKRTDEENFDAAAAAERNWWKKRNSIWVEWFEHVRIDTRYLSHTHTKQISNYFRYVVCFSSNFWRRARLRPGSIALYSQACGMSFEVSQPKWNNKIQNNRTDGRWLSSERKKRTEERVCVVETRGIIAVR